MTSGSISSCEHLVQQVLRYVPVRDLFSCSEVNTLWHRLSLALLRTKLKWVLCVAPRKDEDETWCLRSYCAQLRRFSKIAREAGKKAMLNLLLISTTHDDERSVLNGTRQSLPQDCVTVLFKSKRDRTLNFEECCKGLNSVLVFDSVFKKPRSVLRTRRNRCASKFASSESDTGSLSRVSKFLRRWSKLSVPLDDTGRITTYYVEKTTGHKLQVTTAALMARMKRRSLECILSLRDAFKNVSNTIVVVFQTEPMDMFVMEHIRCVFSDVAVVSLSGETVGEVRSIASDGSSTPPGRGRVTLMLLRLLPAHTEKKAKKKRSKIKTHASV
ncbi:hypothetical protein MTO96_035237 [Rhipicephalus appendiculatus]